MEPAKEQFKDLLDALVCHSWNAYQDAKTASLRQLKLQEFCKEQLKEQALDGVTTNSPELSNAVHKQVAKSTKSLQAQVSQL
jgi:hypothetical protein